MKQLIFSLFIFISASTFAQTEESKQDPLSAEILSLKSNVSKLEKENINLNATIATLDTKLSNVLKRVDSLDVKTDQNCSAISQTAEALGIKISATESSTTQKFTEVDKSLHTNSLIVIIGVLIGIIVSGLVYYVLKIKQHSQKIELDGKIENKTSSLKSDVTNEIEKTKKELQEENVKLDLKLIEILDHQLKSIKQDITFKDSNDHSTVDHSIPLKVADEITRINAYANTLDPNSQDAKALKSSVKRLINTFKASQYEIIDLLGQKYDDGMKISVISYIPDEKLIKGQEIISKIHKPLVKFYGTQIQAAQVDVSISLDN
jgi:hypothetical protein